MATAAGATFPTYGMLSQHSLDAIASLTLQDAEKVTKTARLSAVGHLLLLGDPAENILSAAKKKKDVIVLGRSDMGRLAGLLIGSVSQQVNQLADCPGVHQSSKGAACKPRVELPRLRLPAPVTEMRC